MFHRQLISAVVASLIAAIITAGYMFLNHAMGIEHTEKNFYLTFTCALIIGNTIAVPPIMRTRMVDGFAIGLISSIVTGILFFLITIMG